MILKEPPHEPHHHTFHVGQGSTTRTATGTRDPPSRVRSLRTTGTDGRPLRGGLASCRSRDTGEDLLSRRLSRPIVRELSLPAISQFSGNTDPKVQEMALFYCSTPGSGNPRI